MSDLVTKAAHDPSPQGGHPKVANVLHQLTPDPHREEDTDHLLARDQTVVHLASLIRACKLCNWRVLVGALNSLDELPELSCPSSDAGGLGCTIAGLDKSTINTIVLTEDFE